MSFWRFCCCCCITSSNPSGVLPSGSNSVPSSNVSSVTSSIPTSLSLITSGPSSDPNQKFVSLAKNTNYGRVLKKRMKFTIYLYRGGFQGSFHDRIVVKSSKYGFVTLELGRNSDSGNVILPVCQKFDAPDSDAMIPKKEVECTFRELAEKADECWNKMGSYSIFERNCQDFCNHFLKSVNAPQYTTTKESVTGWFNLWPLTGHSSDSQNS